MHEVGLEGSSRIVEQAITNRKQEVTVRWPVLGCNSDARRSRDALFRVALSSRSLSCKLVGVPSSIHP